MDIESDESERWEDFFGSSTDLTPSLISFYDNRLQEDTVFNADTSKSTTLAQESNTNINSSKQQVATKDNGFEVATNCSKTKATSNVQSVLINRCNVEVNGSVAKPGHFRILSPNVQRLILNSNANIERIESGVTTPYHSVTNSASTKSTKRTIVKQKLSHIPLSRNTCKLTQAGTELVETFESNLSSNESLDKLQISTKKLCSSETIVVAGNVDPADSYNNLGYLQSENVNSISRNDLNEDIHQSESDRISEIIQRFHQMYTSTLSEKDEHIKETMDSILENNIHEIHGSNGKNTFETFNYFVKKPGTNDNCSSTSAKQIFDDSNGANRKINAECHVQSPKKNSPSSSPLLTYSRTKKLGGKTIIRKHSPPASPKENNVDMVSDLKPPAFNMVKTKYRPLSSSSICSTSSNSSSSSEHNQVGSGIGGGSYLASVESLADPSETENVDQTDGGSSLTVLKRSCMEIVDSERAYVKDLFQVIDGYLIRWKDEASLKEDDLKTLFSNIQEIHGFNSHLLEQLILAETDPIKIARCFIDLRDKFDVYTIYCTNYLEAISLLTSLLKASHTNTLLTLTQKSLNHTLPLGSYLLKPVQRILKYHLLLDNLRKHCDNEEVAQAHSIMRQVARNIDQVKKKLEQKSRVKELENNLDGWLGPDLTVLGELKQEGLLMENNKPRHVFLFQTMLIITKPKEDERLQFKQYIYRNNLMLREHLPCEPTSFNVIPYDEPRNQIKLTARNRDQKREWTQSIKDVMLEQFDIPSRAKELVYKLGDEEDRTPDKNTWKWGSNSTTPVYLERRNQYRRSEMRNRSKMKRKTIINSTSFDGFSVNKDHTGRNLTRKQSMDDSMIPTEISLIAPQKQKPGRCNHNTGVCRCSLIRQEFENLTDQNMKERSKSVPRIPGEEEIFSENDKRKLSDSNTLYKFSTLGRSKSAKVADVKVYTTKTIPKRIATIKKNKARKETSTFYMDLSDFDDTVLKITESTDNLESTKKMADGKQSTEDQIQEKHASLQQKELTEEEKTQRAMTKDKLQKDAEIISELLKTNLNCSSKKSPRKRGPDNNCTQSNLEIDGTSDVPPPLPSKSPPPLDLDDNCGSENITQEEHIYESLRRNVHVPYKFSPVLNRSKSQQYYTPRNKTELKSRSLSRPESDYVTLVYSDSGHLQQVDESSSYISSGNETLRNSDSNINYESMSRGKAASATNQCFSSIGDLKAQEFLSNKMSKNLLQRFVRPKGDQHVSTSENSLLPHPKKTVLSRGNKPPERRVSDVTEMCRQSIIHRQGSDAVGERMANADYVDPRTLFVNSTNSTVSLDPQRDSVFSLTSSNDSVSDHNQKTTSIIEETILTPLPKSHSTYFEYEQNVEACLENDFRDSAVYSDDNERRHDEFSELGFSPPPIPKRPVSSLIKAERGYSLHQDSCDKDDKRPVPPPIPTKPQFITPKRFTCAAASITTPSIKSPTENESKSWVLKQIDKFQQME